MNKTKVSLKLMINPDEISNEKILKQLKEIFLKKGVSNFLEFKINRGDYNIGSIFISLMINQEECHINFLIKEINGLEWVNSLEIIDLRNTQAS